MKKNTIAKAVLGAAALCGAVSLNAQTLYDGMTVAGTGLSGTSRFVGMGGAMGALGGDISVMGTNPAGIGLFRSNEISASMGLSVYANESNYLSKRFDNHKTKFAFDQVGAVFSTRMGDRSALRFMNLGFNYHRSKPLFKNMEMGGLLGEQSQSFQMAAQATGIENWGDAKNRLDDPKLGWLSILGYEAFVINPVSGKVGQFTGLEGGSQASFGLKERGGIDQFDANVSFNWYDRFYFGVTLGAYAVDYTKYTFYSESLANGEGYLMESWNAMEGAGFDLKLGAILRPVETSPFRLGLAIHTPTFYNLKYRTSAFIQSELKDKAGAMQQTKVYTPDRLGGGDMVRAFRMRTPWVVQLSVGHVLGRSVALGAEYEYKDYASIRMRDEFGSAEAYEFENHDASTMLKGVHTWRVGAEYKVLPKLALRAGYNHQTAAYKTNAVKYLTDNSIQTDTDFANVKAVNNYTLGIGYRGSSFYADLAYQLSTYQSDFYPFLNVEKKNNVTEYITPEATRLKDNRNHVSLTLGWRF